MILRTMRRWTWSSTALLLSAASANWFLAAAPAYAATYNFVPVGSTVADLSRATCGSGDQPEPLLQGQVPLMTRVAGFKGYSCNLRLLSAAHSQRGDGHWQQFVLVRDRKGHSCGFGGPAYWTGAPGTTVVDLGDPNHLHETALVTTPGLMFPGEGIRASTRRGVLVGAYYTNEYSTNDVTHGFDIYDVGTDCRHPQVLDSTTSISFPTSGLTTTGPSIDRISGHEGALSPDDKIYWVADNAHAVYQAIDISDPRHPKWLAGFSTPAFYNKKATTHGISISDDGNRAYAATLGLGPWGSIVAPATGKSYDGFLILDTSDVQAHKAHPRIRLISENDWHDGSMSQMSIPIRIHDRSYLVTTSEGGAGLARGPGIEAACASGRTPFGMVRIFDISNEAKPRLVKNLILQVNDPKNCSLIMPEVQAMETGSNLLSSVFLYDAHMCSVDNRDNATTLACSYFDSGIRVYDIRDPAHPKEIAYWVPPAAPGEFGWCAAIPILDASKGILYSSCANSGVVALKFTHGAWPFPTSTTPQDKQL